MQQRSCRWCGAAYSSRNQLFKHVRGNAPCMAAAAAEDARATQTLEPRRNVQAAVLNVGGVVDAEQRLAECLTSVGASVLEIAQDSSGFLLARFTCDPSLRGGPHSAGQEALHRCYLACDNVHAAALVPDGSLEELSTRDYSAILSRRATDHLATPKELELSSVVTVVVTTSPMRSDPELDMLEAVFGSLALVGLGACRKILVCDYKEASEEAAAAASADEAPTLKKGSLPAAYVQRYRERLLRLREAAWARDVEVLRRPPDLC